MIDWYKYPYLREKKNRQYVTVAVVVLWIGVLMYFGFFAALKGASESQKQIEVARSLDSQLQIKIDAIETAKRLRAEFATASESVVDAIPSSPKILTFANSVSVLAGNSSLVMQKFEYRGQAESLTKKEKNVNTTPLSFDFVAKGDYFGIEEFVRKLEMLPRLVRISNLSISEDRRSEKDVVVELDDNGNPIPSDGSDLPLVLTIQGELYYTQR